MNEKEMNKRAAELLGWWRGAPNYDPNFEWWFHKDSTATTGFHNMPDDKTKSFPYFSPATDRNHAWLLLAEIERLGLIEQFEVALWELLDIDYIDTDLIFGLNNQDEIWKLIYCDLHKLCAAFIATLEAHNAAGEEA